MNTETYQLSLSLIERIRTLLSSGDQPKIYWDYRDEVSNDLIKKALNDRNYEFPIDAFHEDMFTDIDTYQLELDYIKNTLKDIEKDISKELNCDIEELNLQEIAKDIYSDVFDIISVDINLKELLGRKNVEVRIEMQSNYDCINSDWLESQGTYEMESYFGDMIKMLQFNPVEIKQFLLSKGRKVSGKWPNKPKKQPIISISDFWTELINSSCGANLLTFIGTINAYDLLSINKTKPIVLTIPKGNKCGLFSSTYGGGSLINCTLIKPFVIDLKKKYDKSGYLTFSLFIETHSSDYSISRVYGVDNSFWEGNIEINQHEK